MNHFANPILSGFHPDPSICRVGDDYYLVNSTFEYFPGIPIFHSRDLIHWRQIGHVLTRPAQLPLQDAKPSNGIFAPTLRYRDGLFYVITTNLPSHGNFVVTSTDPAGPWSEPVWIANAEGIDPSLFFDDDGRCWYVGNGSPEQSLYEGHHTLWLQEMDRTTYQLIGPKRVIVDGGSNIAKEPIWIEGPHLYKITGKYYLMAAEGGTAEAHSVVIFRSNAVTGPYEPCPRNPILTNRTLDPNRPQPITCTGHGDLVQTQTGEWWMTLLGCRPYAPFAENWYNTGRETFLAPVVWEDGWPTVGGDGTLAASYPVPDLPTHFWADDYGLMVRRYEFDDAQIPLEFNGIRAIQSGWHSLTVRPGCLRLLLRPETLAGLGVPSFLGVRQRHAAFTAMTAIEFQPKTPSETAGLVVLQNNRTYYALECGVSGDQTVLRLIKHDLDGLREVRSEVPVSSRRLFLRIEGRGKDYTFSYAQEPGQWQTLGGTEDGTILSTRHAGGFVGAYVGLSACSHDQPSANHADFDWFEYRGTE